MRDFKDEPAQLSSKILGSESGGLSVNTMNEIMSGRGCGGNSCCQKGLIGHSVETIMKGNPLYLHSAK
jgi:hypothetical protein